ncbi:MAG: hypothetical protein AAFQ79_05145 [Pseudomonadota bacterium]
MADATGISTGIVNRLVNGVLRGLLIGAACFAVPVSAQDVDPEPSGFLQYLGSASAEDFQEANIAMSGGLIKPLDTGRLFAGLQLIGEDPAKAPFFTPTDLGVVPIWLPGNVSQNANITLCSMIRSYNNVYAADLVHNIDPIAETNGDVGAQETKAKVLEVVTFSYETKFAEKIEKKKFRRSDMLVNMIVDEACPGRRSNIYVPFQQVEKPSHLQAVFEIGSATVSAKVGNWEDGQAKLVNIKEMDCVPTTKVRAGYECVIALGDSGLAAGTYMLTATIKRPGLADAERSIVFALPELAPEE